MNRPNRRTGPMLALACALTLTGSAAAAPPPSRYPLDLDTAIAKAYPATSAASVAGGGAQRRLRDQLDRPEQEDLQPAPADRQRRPPSAVLALATADW